MNENNEVFGAKVSVDTTEAKNKFKQLGEFIRNFGKKAEDDATIMPKLVNTGYQNQINYVKKQMQEIYDNLKIAQKRENEGNAPGYDVEKLKANYEKLSYILVDLLEKQKEFNGETKETAKEGTKTKSVLSNMFDHSISKIKRFTFYLLGARSAFSLFRKYQSIYYQYNEQMQYQSELSQNAIALSLAPAFELLGNVIAYASIGFAKFIELLTGANVLSKVSTKGIRDYNKQLKEQRTLLSGIDEITNLDKTGAGTGLADQYKSLADFQDKVKEVEKFFKENKWIQSLIDGLKQLWEYIKIGYNYIKDHWDIFKYLFGAVAIAIVWQFPLGKLGLLTAGTMALVGWLKKLASSNDEASKATERLRNSEKKLADLRNKQQDAEDEYIEAIDNKKEALDRLTKAQDKTKKSGADLYKQVQEGTVKYEDLDDDLKELYKSYRDYNKSVDNATEKELKFKSATIQVNSEAKKQQGILMENNKTYTKDFEALIKKYRDGEISARQFTLSVESYMQGMTDEYKETFVFSLPDDLKKAWGNALIEMNIGDKNLVRVFENSKFELSYKKVAESVKTNLSDMGKNAINSIQGVIDKLEELKNTKIVNNKLIDIGVKYNIPKSTVQSLIDKVRGISVNLFGMSNSAFNNIANSILKKFGYAKGLDYVPYDEYPALLHKGEAVVPAKYNPSIHSTGNEYTNSLLETLIVKVEDLSRRPNVFEIDGQKFATATYSLYENEGNRQNYIEGVVK